MAAMAERKKQKKVRRTGFDGVGFTLLSSLMFTYVCFRTEENTSRKYRSLLVTLRPRQELAPDHLLRPVTLMQEVHCRKAHAVKIWLFSVLLCES